MGLHGPWGIKLLLIAVLAGLANYVNVYQILSYSNAVCV